MVGSGQEESLHCRNVLTSWQAFMPPGSRRTEVETFQKGHVQPIYAVARPVSEATEMYDTEFEDLSDTEEYSGRRSEESVSDTIPDPPILNESLNL